MKLRFTQEELQAGVATRRLSEKRKARIEGEKVTTGAFSIEPMPLEAKTATGVIITSIDAAGDNKYTLSLKPVSCAVFEVYSHRGNLNSLTLDLPKQVTINDSGTHETHLTLFGDGTDTESKDRAKLAFGRLIASDAGNPLVRAMITHLSTLK